MRDIEQRIAEAIDGFSFLEAATALTMALSELALKESGGNRAAVKAIFYEIAQDYDAVTLH